MVKLTKRKKEETQINKIRGEEKNTTKKFRKKNEGMLLKTYVQIIWEMEKK